MFIAKSNRDLEDVQRYNQGSKVSSRNGHSNLLSSYNSTILVPNSSEKQKYVGSFMSSLPEYQKTMYPDVVVHYDNSYQTNSSVEHLRGK